MNKKIFLIITCLVVMSGTINSQTNGFGLGLILGEPTGISIKQWIKPDYSINGAAAWSFIDDSAIHLHADYVFHNFCIYGIKA